ncbi:MAG: lysostaphin resistance A-like protein [Actinomycetota bacterium]
MATRERWPTSNSPSPSRLSAASPAQIAPIVILVAGIAVLVVRPFIVAGPEPRTVLFALSYVAIWAAALAPPIRAEQGTLSVAFTFAIGLAAVALASALAGTAVPMPSSAWAAPLAFLAAVAEEALFRRTAYAQLARFGVVAAILGSAALFAAVHAPAYGVAALPVDLGAGLLFGWQRWASGSWIVPAGTHAAANLWVVLA